VATVGKRRRSREMALQMLYQQELGGSSLEDIFTAFDLDSYLEETDSVESSGSPKERRRRAERSLEYARTLVAGVVEHREHLDEVIRRQAENWRLERMPTIDRGILRLAVYEMIFEDSVPKVVVVDEAIELAKKFGSESSGRFVNGLLDGILQADGAQPPDAETLPTAVEEATPKTEETPPTEKNP
jgi:N utilization substance protein B